MKKTVIILVLITMCLCLSGCGAQWLKCWGCGPGYYDPTQAQVADPCWPCWKARSEEQQDPNEI